MRVQLRDPRLPLVLWSHTDTPCHDSAHRSHVLSPFVVSVSTSTSAFLLYVPTHLTIVAVYGSNREIQETFEPV